MAKKKEIKSLVVQSPTTLSVKQIDLNKKELAEIIINEKEYELENKLLNIKQRFKDVIDTIEKMDTNKLEKFINSKLEEHLLNKLSNYDIKINLDKFKITYNTLHITDFKSLYSPLSSGLPLGKALIKYHASYYLDNVDVSISFNSGRVLNEYLLVEEKKLCNELLKEYRSIENQLQEFQRNSKLIKTRIMKAELTKTEQGKIILSELQNIIDNLK